MYKILNEIDMSSPHILLNNPQKSKFIPSVRHLRGKIPQKSYLKHILLNYDLFYLTNPTFSYIFVCYPWPPTWIVLLPWYQPIVLPWYWSIWNIYRGNSIDIDHLPHPDMSILSWICRVLSWQWALWNGAGRRGRGSYVLRCGSTAMTYKNRKTTQRTQLISR